MNNYVLTDSDKQLATNFLGVNNTMLVLFNSEVNKELLENYFNVEKINWLYMPIYEGEQSIIDKIGVVKSASFLNYIHDIYEKRDIDISRHIMDVVIYGDVDNLVFQRISKKLETKYMLWLNDRVLELHDRTSKIREYNRYKNRSDSFEIYNSLYLELFNAFLIYMNEEIDKNTDISVKKKLISVILNVSFVYEPFERELINGTLRNIDTLYLNFEKQITDLEIIDPISYYLIKYKVANNCMGTAITETMELTDEDYNDVKKRSIIISNICLIKASLLIIDRERRRDLIHFVLKLVSKHGNSNNVFIRELIVNSCRDLKTDCKSLDRKRIIPL